MRTLIFCLLFSVHIPTICQSLISSRQTSYHTFIYQITNREAFQINSKKHWSVDSTFFHTLIDTHPTDSSYQKTLPTGHYLKVYVEGNELQLDYTSVQPFSVDVMNNSTDLSVKVVDMEGAAIRDARVKVKDRKVSFDEKTQTFRHHKSNKKGLLSVTIAGHTAFYDLDRRMNNPWSKRVFRKIIYGSPLKYAWRPVNFVIHVPIDGVKSILRWYPLGSIRSISYHSERLFHTVACWFDDYHCDWYGDDWKFREKHTGYMAFSKPKYMPGDTVKLKAFITKKNGNPISKPVWATINNYPNTVKLSKIQPYDYGGYACEFVLHDTLDLTLDRNYTVDISDQRDRTYIGKSFTYEDYELGKIKLDLSTSQTKQLRGDTAVIEVKGTDENDLNLLDGRLEVLVTPGTLRDYFQKDLFLPDTLSYFTLDLEPRGKTDVKIPDSIFPKANLDYKVEIRLRTSNNEVLGESEYLTFYEHQELYAYKLNEDSIELQYKLNGKVINRSVDVIGFDAFQNPADTLSVELPASISLNPHYQYYQVMNEGQSKLHIDISEEESMVSFRAHRTSDSLIIDSYNPHKIPFVYYLYKTNNELLRGHGKELSIKRRTSTGKNYYLSVQYVWGGQVVDNNYEIALDQNSLQVDITAPPVVYPGQHVELQVEVKDAKGKPVEDVDILAHGLTKKFKALPTSMPTYAKSRKERQLINTFELNRQPHYEEKRSYDYDRWNPLMALDSIAYFKFLYPNGIYQYSYVPGDGRTQFSPFVVREGVVQPVAVVYVDRAPVYFSWTTDEPYSFAIDSGYHQVQIRTAEYEYFLDSIYFEFGQKLIFSVDHDDLPRGVMVSERGVEVTNRERDNLARYVMPYRYTFQYRFGYIQQGKRFFSLKPPVYPHIAGPVHMSNLDFKLLGGFSQNFTFDPYFEYEISVGLIKMRSQELNALVPKYFKKDARTEFQDIIYSEQSLKVDWQQELMRRRIQSRKYSNPRYTRPGQGKLIVDVVPKADETVLNTLLFKHDDLKFLNVYPGINTHFNALKSGYYRLIYLKENGAYAVKDSIDVRVNGTNYFHFEEKWNDKDTFSTKLNELLDSYFEEHRNHPLNQEAKKELFKTYQQQYQYFGAGETISGYVYSESGETLPGVNVLVKGTTFGTVTDIDGFYSIKVPYDYTELNFSFIGFASRDVNVSNMSSAVVLEEDVQQLQEVVVMGYGVAEKKSLMASASTVLKGKVAGVSMAPGATSTIRIRGLSSISREEQPLVIVDGVVYLGDLSDLQEDDIDDMKILKSEELTALYGARAANGVLFISTDGAIKSDPLEEIGETEVDDFAVSADPSSAIRNNFSDEAFWEPRLKTDKNGQVTFKVQFPDDITQWETFVYAINGDKQTGNASQGIKSFKPLSAQLSLPRFLVTGDRTNAIGKSLNYGLDTVSIQTTFEVNGNEIWKKNESLVNAVIDSLRLEASDQDSLQVKYFLTREDGYVDGEERTLPVFPAGVEKNLGQYAVMYEDTSLSWSFVDSLGLVHFYVNTRSMDLLAHKINYLIDYKFECNEQLASKLIALLVSQHLNDGLNIKEARDRQVKRIIKKLANNQNSDGLWGWWNISSTNLWISTHVVEALLLARDNGFKVDFNESIIADEAIWNLTSRQKLTEQVDWLYLAQMLELSIDRLNFVRQFDSARLDIRSRLRLEWIKSALEVERDNEWLMSMLDRDQMGRQFIRDTSTNISYHSDRSLEYTTMALHLLANDSSTIDVRPMEDYLIDKLSRSWYTNTYNTSKALAVLAESLSVGSVNLNAQMIVSGNGMEQRIDQFPFKTTFTGSSLKMDKSGQSPIYANAYQTYWVKEPVADTTSFLVQSFFESGAKDLIAGNSETLVVNVEVYRDSEYVMVEVPIPAGCSYVSKSNYYHGEIHREYFKEKVSIFYRSLNKGTHQVKVELMPRYSGYYTLNPAKAELMYFPVFYGHESAKKIYIK